MPHCDQNSALFIPQKSSIWYISKNYLTRIECSIRSKNSKNSKSPEIIESGSKIRNPEKKFCQFFFSDSFASIFHEKNLSQN